MLEGLPGARHGAVELRIARRNRGAARALLTELEMARADLALERARGPDDEMDRALPGG